MSQDFSNTALLAAIKRQGMLPDTTGTLGSTDFLAIATEQIQSYMMELLLSVREEYNVTSSDVAVVSGTDTYPIPARAIGGKLSDVKFASTGSTIYSPLTRVDPHARDTFRQNGDSSWGYMFEGNNLVLLPSPTSAGTLRLTYFLRPSALVLPAATATISSINAGRTVITTSATIPTTFLTSSTFDVVDNSPGFTTLVTDNAASGTVSGTTITLGTALPTTVSAGDYVCLAGESPVPQIPVELHSLLAQRVVVKCLEALGDKNVSIAKAMCDESRRMAVTLLSPRAENSPRVIVQRSGPGFRRRGRWGY